jgi:hypothetical protein
MGNEGLSKSQKALKVALARAMIDSFLCDSPRTVSISMAETDGRKHAPLIKWAVKAGLATAVDTRHVKALNKAFNVVPEVKPELWKAWKKHGINGIIFTRLPVGEQKWVLCHKDDFQVFTVNRELYNGSPEEETTNARLFDEGFPWQDMDAKSYEAARAAWDDPDEEFGKGTVTSYRCIVVTDTSLLLAVRGHERDVTIKKLMRLNVGYMLAKLGILTEDEAEGVRVRDDRNPRPFGKPSPLTLSPNSNEWPKQIGPKLDGVLEEIDMLLGFAKVLRKLQDADWGTVLSGLKALAVDHVDGEAE